MKRVRYKLEMFWLFLRNPLYVIRFEKALRRLKAKGLVKSRTVNGVEMLRLSEEQEGEAK